MKFFTSALAVILFLGMTPAGRTQDAPRSGVYHIQTGEYLELGGFVGVIEEGLPYPAQAYVSLNFDSFGKAQLSFLSQNQQSTFYVKLTNGVVTANTIRFQYLTTRPLSFDTNQTTQVDYTVTNAAGHLSINGAMDSPYVCCDIPNWFSHSNVLATFVPTLNVSLSNGVTVYWPSATNQSYQVQYLSDFSHDTWTNLGNAVPGNGTTNSLAVDMTPTGQSSKFFRIVTVP